MQGEKSLAGKDYYQKNKDRIKAATSRYYYNNKYKRLQKDAERNYDIKVEVLTYYGGEKCVCVLCGENDVDCLTIDHINDDGKEQRSKIQKVSGSSFYKWLLNNDFPEGLQTLCANCNLKKEIKRKRDRRGTCLN